jgi:hypothetical protein
MMECLYLIHFLNWYIDTSKLIHTYDWGTIHPQIGIVSRGNSIGGCPLLSTIQLIIARSVVLHKNKMDDYNYTAGKINGRGSPLIHPLHTYICRTFFFSFLTPLYLNNSYSPTHILLHPFNTSFYLYLSLSITLSIFNHINNL